MKRAASFILLLVFFTVTTGFTVNLHYCMDKFQSWELGSADDDACSVCGMDTGENTGCCRDELKLVKLQDDDFDSYTLSLKLQIPEVNELLSVSLPPVAYSLASVRTLAPPDPDTGQGQGIYLRNRVFRI